MAQTSTLKNTLLMVAPVAVLGALGLLLKNREPAVFTVTPPFQVFIKNVRLVPIKPSEVQEGYDTKVEVELGAKGHGTWWWKRGFGGYTMTNGGQILIGGKESSRLVGSPWQTQPHVEKTDKGALRWVTAYLLKLAPIPAESGDIRLRHRIQIISDFGSKMGNPLWLDTVVRRNGQKTLLPQVLHDPHLVLENWQLEEIPPVEKFLGGGTYQWRLSQCFRKKGLLSDTSQTGVTQILAIYDSAGHRSPMLGSSWQSLFPRATSSSRPDNQAEPNPRLTYMGRDFSDRAPNDPFANIYSKLKPPLWIEGKASWKGNWPILIKIPLRDA